MSKEAPSKSIVVPGLLLAGMLATNIGALHNHDSTWGCVGGALAILILVLVGILWAGGVRGAGRGWRRQVFLLAFAAPIAHLGLTLPEMPSSFKAGWEAGRVEESGGVIRKQTASQQPASPPDFSETWAFWVSWAVLTVILMALLDRLERRGAEAERQQELAREARSEALRNKLAPHFIFNALNTLHAQIDQDPRAAQATTEHLAQLFRQVIAASDRPTIPLKEELAFVEAYLGIERARLGDRLRVTVEVPEALETAQVPPLALQVLVENAIKHGVAPLEQGGEVRIGAEQKGGALHLWVEDPGPGVSALQGTGTALATLRQRLEKPEDLDMGLVEGRHRVGFRWRQV